MYRQRFTLSTRYLSSKTTVCIRWNQCVLSDWWLCVRDIILDREVGRQGQRRSTGEDHWASMFMRKPCVGCDAASHAFQHNRETKMGCKGVESDEVRFGLHGMFRATML